MPCPSSLKPIRSIPASSAPDARPGTPEFDLFIKEVVREMTVKAGQKCTAIRKALVPAAASGEVVAALQAALQKIVVGDPRAEGVRMGPLVSQEQRTDVLERVAELHREAELVAGELGRFEVKGADRERGAFVPPLLLLCNDPSRRARRPRSGGLRSGGHGAAVQRYGGGDRTRAAQRRQSRRLGVYRR